MTSKSEIMVPDGFTLHTENTSHVLLASDEAFLNPVQEFNRDLSVACIRIWSEELSKSKELKWKQTQGQKSKKSKLDSSKVPDTSQPAVGLIDLDERRPPRAPEPFKFTLLEALSATGLRSIRYAKEIPLIRCVIANDLSHSAVEAIRRNLALNELGSDDDALSPGKVKVNEGDACTLMYAHRDGKDQVDVVDLDPYGTAAPFIDAAMQCIKDNGLLCVTCTDLSVLATTNYPEKCFSNYGGVPLKAEYCHEAALRLVLHSLSTSASRYGRYIQPYLSLSIDFYVRLFVRVKTSALEAKKALTKTSTYYICSACQSFYDQPLGRVVEKELTSGGVNSIYKIQSGPGVGNRCPECDSVLHIAGPMWSGPLHDTIFVTKVLEHLEANSGKYGTTVRMKGMLTVAREELQTPFYFTPSKIASFFHCATPSLDDIASALLHAGHKISRSHACPGSLKTTARRQDIHSIFRSWVKLHPVKLENVSETSPARRLLAREPAFEANFNKHPDSVTSSGKVKIIRYQENPTSHWGPGTKAASGKSKRKRASDDG